MTEPKRLENFTARVLITLLLITLALAFWAVRDTLLLLFFAVLLAITVHGMADVLMMRLPLPRPLALFFATLALIGIIGSAFWIFGAQIANDLVNLVERLPGAWTRVRETLESNPFGAGLVAEIENAASGASAGSLQGLLMSVGGYALPLASGATTALLVVFIAGFLTTSAGSFRRGVLLLLPHGTDAKVGDALDASARALKKWLLGITINMVIVAVLMAVVLWALGVPAFLGLALIAGLSQFVPTIGPLLSSIPGILLAFTVGPMTALWTLIAYVVVAQLESALIAPLVQEKTACLPPALTLIAVLAASMLLGPLGVLLATPMLVVGSVFVVKLYVHDTLNKEAGYPGQ